MGMNRRWGRLGDAARKHFHIRATELYYVLEGQGVVVLDGEEHPVRKSSLVHIPPGVVHGARGRMRVLVTCIPISFTPAKIEGPRPWFSGLVPSLEAAESG